MPSQMLLTLASVFVSVAVLIGVGAFVLLSRSSHGRRRLTALSQPAVVSGLVVEEGALADVPDPEWNSLLNALPTSRGSVKRLRREMALAGYQSARAGAMISLAELVFPILLAVPPIFLLTGMNRWLVAGLGAVFGYMLPGVLLNMRVKKRKHEIENGLADALDLLVLCLEAGSSLDQAIVKAGEELSVAYPALGDQLHILISEMRAGKPRLDAFRSLADRTHVDDVRAMVAMLIQTDKFGTSIAQALRTHAEVCRTKRRQRAEERAQKVGVKLVFPLVFCLFPALYVVMLGPAYLEFMKVFVGAQ
ncbi:MAG: type II secretion system F family protein [Vicinamibacterales bacterium]